MKKDNFLIDISVQLGSAPENVSITCIFLFEIILMVMKARKHKLFIFQICTEFLINIKDLKFQFIVFDKWASRSSR